MRADLHIGRRLVELRQRLHRARYFRGHGVHSPFVYDIVRNVFLRDELLPGDRTLYRTLIAQKLEVRRAVQLQNLAIHCGYATFGINCAQGALWVVTQEVPFEQLSSLVLAAASAGSTVVILSPCACPQRGEVCRRLVEEHASTTIDNRSYLLIFNNHLPKQHFSL